MDSSEKPYFSEKRVKRAQWTAFWIIFAPIILIALIVII